MKILYKPFLSCCPEAAVIYSISSNVTRNITSSEFEKKWRKQKGGDSRSSKTNPSGGNRDFQKENLKEHFGIGKIKIYNKGLL